MSLATWLQKEILIMRIRIALLSVILMLSALPLRADTATTPLVFERQRIGDVTYEAASAFDVNNDGIIDIVSGVYWFEGPQLTTRHEITTLPLIGDYYDDFSDYPMDVNGDGYLDIVTGAWWGETLRWRENPKGASVPWTIHDIARTGSIERPCFYDLDGDGQPEVIPNCPGAPVKVFKLVRDKSGSGSFVECAVSDFPMGHGMGFGDLNADGRPDIILPAGWFEQPEDPWSALWAWHPEFDLGPSCGVPALCHDINADGLMDIIAGQGHAYGLAWWEQQKDTNGNRSWLKHDIDSDRSQYHDMQLVDIDNDGQLELLTGKRYRAHSGHDPGSNDPIGLYYFKINSGNFKRYTIAYGPKGEGKGAGIYFWVEDLNGNGWKDIVAPGKDGLCLFRNLGK